MENDTASSRQMWLSIALAVARDGLPVPGRLGLHNNIVSMSLETHDDVRKWAAHLGLGECRINVGGDGSLWAPHFERDGWSWQVYCHRPAEPTALAEQVVEAILTPDVVSS